MEKLVIGIDFSKESMNYCCVQGTAHSKVLEGVVANSVDGCKEMVRHLRVLFPKARVKDFLFCGENTGVYSLAVSDYLYSKKYVMWLENPLQIKLSCGMRREKTDKADARMIAEYAFRHQDKARPYNPQSEGIRKLKTWLKTHDALTQAKKSLKNLAACMEAVPLTLRKSIAELEEQLKQTDKKIKQLLESEEELSLNASLLMSVPGVGIVTTAALLIDTRNFTRFCNPRKYASHTGCVPCKHESGTSIHRKARVSKASNRYVNSLLTEGSVSLMIHNKEMREYADRKRKEGKDNGCIINNIRNKTIHRVFAVIRKQEPFDKNYQWNMKKDIPESFFTGMSINDNFLLN